jgi:hypothetical protein
MAGAVIAGLTNNPSFPAPTVDLKAVQAAADDLNAALAAQALGGSAATAEKNNKQEALITVLRKVKHYVEDNCGKFGVRSGKLKNIVLYPRRGRQK